MCLYPRFIPNKKYLPTKKNNYNPPVCKDWRVSVVPIACGKCIECKRAKAREWKVRLNEEIKENEKKYFITLSFSPESLLKLKKYYEEKFDEKIKDIECNQIATLAVRLFLERYRKKYKKSIKHWLITELGDKYTERIHLHGIIWTEHIEEIEKIWSYGNIWLGDYVNSKTINYIVKYVTKIDQKHPNYEQIILCSAGLGKNYINTIDAKLSKYRPLATREYYQLPNGAKCSQPIYYRNKLYSEEEREKLWIEKIEKHEQYILGTPYPIRTKEEQEKVQKIREEAQEYNIKMGYGDNSAKWKKKKYLVTQEMLNKANKTQRQRTGK